jgi:Putative zinc-finger
MGVPVEPSASRRLLRDVARTDDEEISCSECFDLVSRYVDRPVTESLGDGALARLQQHLRQCGVCREEYEILRDLVGLDADGRGPSADDVRT